MARDARGNIVPDADLTGIKIDAQMETVGIGPDQRPTSGYKVMFTTREGVSGSVFVPMSSYSPANVKAAVAAHAAQLDEVQRIGR